MKRVDSTFGRPVTLLTQFLIDRAANAKQAAK
jgi:hypothetical protein